MREAHPALSVSVVLHSAANDAGLLLTRWQFARQDNWQSCNSSATGLGVIECGKVASVPARMIQAERNGGISKVQLLFSCVSMQPHGIIIHAGLQRERIGC